MITVVGISEMKVSNRDDEVLITYSLGSCLGVTIYDPAIRVGGMIHCMLPLSKVDPQKAEAKPYMFVNTGIPALFKEVFHLGARKDRLIVKAAGCAQILDAKGLFKIGHRNHTIFRKILWKNNLLIEAEDIGGTISRTMRLEIGTGLVTVKSGGQEVEL